MNEEIEDIEFDENNNGWVKEDADHSKCGVTSCIAEATSFGRGHCDHLGFWEYGCYHCARKAEQEKLPEHDECWPFSNETLNQANKTLTSCQDVV